MSETRNPAEVERLFVEALERRGDERVAFLDDACADDVALRAHLLELVDAHERAGEFLQPVMTSPPENPTVEGRRIGRYTLRRVIATGGMGTVYEAMQEQPHRTVAVKVMRTGVTSRSSRRRFEYESQILARLRHPNIAQVFEAGTHDEGSGAVPYFAMEYIADARPLVLFAQEERLSARQRLELFAKVCDAVQHGHQKGVIHRDIKPANILVDPAGDPKVIDFGVARATDSDMAITTLKSDVGQLIGTLQYMSPEQCDADPHDLDARSDVYMLGVVLYELLTGRPPYELSNVAVPEAVRIIRDETPTRPSTLDRGLRGDLETIAITALEKDRQRRYQTAGELGADIRRYLDGQPIIARPPSALYQLRKFARRHRTLVGGLAAALVLLLAGAGGILWQWKAARGEAARATAINDFLMRMMALANPRGDLDDLAETGLDPRMLTIADLLDRAGGEIDEAFPDWPDVQEELHFRLARAYSGLGRTEDSEAHFARSYELRAATLGVDHPDTLVGLSYWADAQDVLDDYVYTLPLHRRASEGLHHTLGPTDKRTLSIDLYLANRLLHEGQREEGVQLFERTIATARRELGDGHRTSLTAMRMYASHLIGERGESEQGAALFEEALQIARRELPPDSMITVRLAHGLGRARLAQGRYEEALPLLQFVHDVEWDRPGILFDSIRATNYLCSALRALDRYEEAEGVFREQLRRCTIELGYTDRFTMWATERLANHLVIQERYSDAEAELLPQLDRYVAVHGYEKWAGIGARQLALIYQRQGRLDDAEGMLRNALKGMRNVREREMLSFGYRMALAWFLSDRGPATLAEAERLAREAVESYERIRGREHVSTLDNMDTLAAILLKAGKVADAERLCRQITDRASSAHGNDHWTALLGHGRLGVCLVRLGDYEEAEPLLVQALPLFTSRWGESNDLTLQIRDALVTLYESTDRPALADELLTPTGEAQASDAAR